MKIKSTLFILLFHLFLIFPFLAAENIQLGAEDGWKGTILHNLESSPGKGGFLDLVLSRTELTVSDEYTDLLLSLNRESATDRTGHYRLEAHPVYGSRYFKSGSGSATFNRENRLVLQSDDSDTLFSPYSNWEDFSIEFWLYPANPREGERIISWEGLGRKDDEIYSQSILCHFINRRLVWSFNNVFQLPDTPESHYEISGDAVLPRQWNHHLLRFDSRTGMLEYLINGLPSAIIYTTPGGNESNTVFTPRIGEEPGKIILGDGFTGFMDEFRIERRFNDAPSISRYNRPGYGVSPVLDLDFSDSRIDEIEVMAGSPDNTAVYGYYLATNSLLEAERARQSFKGEESIMANDGIWTPVENGIQGAKGRFLVISFLLFPDMKNDISPSLSFLDIGYTPSFPPLPPTHIRFEKEEEGIRLEWTPSATPDVVGYLLFFGEKPGEYIYPGSPVKIEKENYTFIDGLSPFKQYFFSVRSYTGGAEPRYSDFSEEISVRP